MTARKAALKRQIKALVDRLADVETNEDAITLTGMIHFKIQELRRELDADFKAFQKK